MRAVSFGCAAVMMAGCGPRETDFVSDYVTSYCVYYLACSDPALAVFDGVDTPEECADAFGPGVAELATECALNGAAARDCLAELDGLACSGDPSDVDAALPAVCGSAWEKCVFLEEEG